MECPGDTRRIARAELASWLSTRSADHFRRLTIRPPALPEVSLCRVASHPCRIAAIRGLLEPGKRLADASALGHGDQANRLPWQR